MEYKTTPLSDERGQPFYGWLAASHYFSFEKLRVIKDGSVSKSRERGKHVKECVETITIPLLGVLEYSDSTQAMSTETGSSHFKENNSQVDQVRLFQIELEPKRRHFNEVVTIGTWTEVLMPMGLGSFHDLKVNPNASVKRGSFCKGMVENYKPDVLGNGLCLFVVKGEVSIGGKNFLKERGAIVIENVARLKLDILEDAELLVVELPF